MTESASPQFAGESIPMDPGESPGLSESPVFDLVEAINRCYGERDMFVDMAEFFRTDSVQLLAQMREAVRSDDALEIARAAHRMKGTVVYLGAGPAATAAMRVENLGRDGDLTNAAEAVDQLAQQVRLLSDALAVAIQSERSGDLNC